MSYLPNPKREQYFFQIFGRTAVPSEFQHTPPSGFPARPTYPDTLSGPDQDALETWRQTTGPSKDTLYAGLSGPAQAKANQFLAWDAARQAWDATNMLARMAQFAWAMADAAISNEVTIPKSGNISGVGSGAPSSPQLAQQP